jgi:hypothetical protein
MPAPTTDAILALFAKHDISYVPDLVREIDSAWIPIVDDLFTHLIRLGWDRQLAQVKEKFDELRVYIDDTTPEMQRRIHDAVVRSRETPRERCALHTRTASSDDSV